MSNQIIMRPCYNRPEMLKLSIEYEIAAREYFDIGEDLYTIFIVEYGSPEAVLRLIDTYPYPKSVIKRTSKFGLSKNILDGFKTAFPFTDDWLIYIEDDILLHKTYFQYIYTVLLNKELNNFSVISAYNFDDSGDVHKIRKDRHYAALAPLISKEFYYTYVEPCSCEAFYSNPAQYVCRMNDMYLDYQKDRTYRYKDSTHHQQAGLINRLMDVSRVEEGKYVVMPEVNRIQHIGIYGHNRRVGKGLIGNTLEERTEYLRAVIKDSKLMYEMAGSKEYNDYKIFSYKLDHWDGTLTLADKHFTS